jgi:hypothetical protein
LDRHAAERKLQAMQNVPQGWRKVAYVVLVAACGAALAFGGFIGATIVWGSMILITVVYNVRERRRRRTSHQATPRSP